MAVGITTEIIVPVVVVVVAVKVVVAGQTGPGRNRQKAHVTRINLCGATVENKCIWIHGY